jgi:hypothetical protein
MEIAPVVDLVESLACLPPVVDFKFMVEEAVALPERPIFEAEATGAMPRPTLLATAVEEKS